MAYMFYKELKAIGVETSFIVLGELEDDDSIMGDCDDIAHILVAVTVDGEGDYWLDTTGLCMDGAHRYAESYEDHKHFTAANIKESAVYRGWNPAFDRSDLLKCRRKIRKVFKRLPSE